jgi:hypothetical protein
LIWDIYPKANLLFRFEHQTERDGQGTFSPKSFIEASGSSLWMSWYSISFRGMSKIYAFPARDQGSSMVAGNNEIITTKIISIKRYSEFANSMGAKKEILKPIHFL